MIKYKITLNIPLFLFSRSIRRIVKGLKSEFELAMVNVTSVFESLKFEFYCIWFKFQQLENFIRSAYIRYPASILYKSIAGHYRPVRVADGPITARYRFIKNAYWVVCCSLTYYDLLKRLPTGLKQQDHILIIFSYLPQKIVFDTSNKIPQRMFIGSKYSHQPAWETS